jgi:DNA-binding transcriptional LysR family regulator
VSALDEHLEKVRTFAVVAQSGSIRSAAGRLRRTQPSISRSLRVLEGAVGATLFERSRHGMTLSRAGKLLYDFSERLASEVARVGAQLDGGGDVLSGRLVCGAYESLAAHIWPGFFRRFTARYPSVELVLRTGGTEPLWSLLRRGTLDLILTEGSHASREVESRLLYWETMGFFATPDHLRRIGAQGSRLTRDKLVETSLLLCINADAGGGRTLAKALALAGLETPRVHVLDTFHLALLFALEDLGVAVLPQRVADDAAKQGRLVRCEIDKAALKQLGKHAISASWLRANHSDPLVRGVVRELAAHLG